VASEQDWCAGMWALPTLPSVLFRFLGLVGDPGVGTLELAEFIWKDPALLSRALPMASAPSMATSEEGGSLRAAVADLGRQRLRNLAFTTPLLRSLEPVGLGAYALTFWERSLLCAVVCEAAARHLHLPGPERYYVAGLVHDVGYLVLLQKRPSLLPIIFQRWASQPSRLLEIEKELIGMDHCQMGLEAASTLGLDPWLYPTISDHHSPTEDSDLASRLTCIASVFCNYQGLDLLPRRSLSRGARERELHEVIRVLLPSRSGEEQARLLEEMEGAARPVRHAIRQAVLEWELSGESRGLPELGRHSARSAGPVIV
jgi:HD-like signal output (HDOD) protein